MAIVYANANGNLSNVAIWSSAGAAYGQLPQVGDNVYANGYTVTMDVDINIYVSPTVGNFLTSVCPYTGIGGGQFSFNSNRNLLANFWGGTTACLVKTATTSFTLTTKYIYGGSGSNAYGLNFSSNGTVNCEDIIGGSGSNAHGFHAGGNNCTLNCGIITGGSGGAGVSNVLGAINCIKSIAGIKEGITYGTTAAPNMVITVSSDVEASATANGINVNSGLVQITSGAMKNVGTFQAVYAPKLRITPAASTVWTIQDTDGDDILLYTADAFDYPIEADVRDGVNYGTIYDGTLAVPPPASVALNVPVDNTVGTLVTATTPADFIAALKLDDLGKRLGKCATTANVNNGLAAYDV